ncbi:cell division control protein 16 [Rhodotorula toruloides]|uniref:Cell division control protein 16 n=1 Tax=Rhodotorula toruloides TaxID=5286 RepID=A0A511K8J1_RHOTO|nr:cell division control protein 16 [Rhodotorula toruloides]
MLPHPATATPNFRATPSPFAERIHPRDAARKAQYDASTSGNMSNEHVEGLRRQSNLSTLSLSPRRPSLAPSGSTATARATRRGTPLAFPPTKLDGDDSGFLSQTVDEDAPWTMVDRMRNWRNDAMIQHLYDSAKFWGGKVLEMTGNPDDAFWLAQIHFLTHQFAQAERILTAPRLSAAASTSTTPPARLTDMSLACRYLAAQCMVRLGKWEEALDMLTASAAHLRGLIHLHMKSNELAKEAFMEALTRDVKCFESFEMLSLPFHAQTEDDAEFVRMMYTVRLKKLSHSNDMAIARQRLTDDYGLGEDPDVLFSRADELYNAMRYVECFKITSHIVSLHPYHRPSLPLHLSCMHHIPNLRSRLFLLAHEMVENEPDDAISWYAVGLWYFSGKRWEESRRFFGKSVLIDPRFGPAWLAYAHSFAYEGEHDQAITAYSTAQRHLPGSHLPLLFIGMQHLSLANVSLAEEYLLAAQEICRGDPLVVNELGVIALHHQHYERAVQCFQDALMLARRAQSSPSAWSAAHLNLGHAYRRLKQWDKAHTSFRRVLELDPRSAAAYSALGIVEHQRGNVQAAIARYHASLAIAPGDPVTCDLLKLALDDISTRVSSPNFAFPGLPPRVNSDLEEQVRALDEEIRAGGTGRLAPPLDSEADDVDAVVTMQSASVSGIEVGMSEDEEDGGETMDMTGEGG